MSKPQHPAIAELYKLIQKKDWSEFYPEKIRQQMLDMWVEKWITSVEYSQSVVDTKYLSIEYNDVIKTKIAQSISDDLMEECVDYDIKDREILGEVTALRRERK